MVAKVHVLLKKEELDPERLDGKVVLVLDILFATSTIVTALAHGCKEVLPALDGDSALAAAKGLPEDSFLLCGELNAITLPGFGHPTPLALLNRPLKGRRLIYSTTNGTVALCNAQKAAHVYAAALLNGEAVVRHVLREHPGSTVLIECSGSGGRFNLEDFYGAGYLVSLLRRLGRVGDLTDAALAAEKLHENVPAEECLLASRVGRMMQNHPPRIEEVRFAATKSRYEVIPRLCSDGLLRL